MSNSVELTNTGQILVQEVSEQIIELTAPTAPVTVEVVTAGPQGASVSTLNDIGDVDTTGKVNQSVLYYDTDTGLWLGNDINTIVSITDGGNW